MFHEHKISPNSPSAVNAVNFFFLPDRFSQFFSMLIVQEMLVLSEFVQSQMFPEKSEKSKVETENSNMENLRYVWCLPQTKTRQTAADDGGSGGLGFE